MLTNETVARGGPPTPTSVDHSISLICRLMSFKGWTLVLVDPHLQCKLMLLRSGAHLICRLMSFKGWAPLKWSMGNLMFVKGGPPSTYNKCFKLQYKNYWLIYHFTIDFVAIVFVLHCSCDLHEYYIYVLILFPPYCAMCMDDKGQLFFSSNAWGLNCETAALPACSLNFF